MMSGALPRGKRLPPRPSADLGYGSRGPQNPYEVQSEREDEPPSRNYTSSRMNPQTQSPPARVMLDGYKADIINGFEGETPRYNPMNVARPQSSTLLDLNDSVQVHLLVETALGDSKEHEILSEGEVDDLKKQCRTLSQRIEQTRQNLMVQSKYRDATNSMSKLYTSENKRSIDGANGKMRALLGHDRNGSEHAQADQERLASEKKCEDLASELWMLEKKLMEPQMKLLKHTAGILQMTHKGPKMMSKGQTAVGISGIPGSPESMYTYSNARNSFEPLPGDDLIFDERSLYRSFNQLDGLGALGGESGFPTSKEQMAMISDTEQRLEDLNSQLRDLIVQNNPQQEATYELPPLSRSGDEETKGPGEALQSSLDYLEQGIAAISSDMPSNGNQGQMETVMMGLWEIILSGEEEARRRKAERRQTRSMNNLPPDEDDMSADEDGDPNESFSPQAFSAKVQWLYSQATKLKDQKKVLQRQIKQQRELNSKSDATKDAEIAQKSEELTRTQDLLMRTETDADNVREQLSLVIEQLDGAKGGSTRLPALEEELQDTKSKISSLTKEIESKDQEAENMNMELARLQTEVTIARAELDGAYGSRAQRAAEVAANPAIQKEIDDLSKKNTSLEEEMAALKAKGTVGPETEDKMRTLKKELEETIEEYEQMTKASIEWEKDREQLESSIDKLRDEREQLETQLSDEKVRWLGMKSPGVDGAAPSPGSTSTTVMRNEFKKMMRDIRAENAKALRAEQAERRKLEDELRALKRAHGPGKSSLSQSFGSP